MEKVQKDRLARSLDNSFLLQSNQEEIMASRSTGAMFDLDQTLHPIFLNDEESVKFERDFSCGKGLLPEHTRNSKTKEKNQSPESVMHVTKKSSSLLSCNERTRVNKRQLLDVESRDDNDLVSTPSIDAPLMTLEEKKEEQ